METSSFMVDNNQCLGLLIKANQIDLLAKTFRTLSEWDGKAMIRNRGMPKDPGRLF